MGSEMCIRDSLFTCHEGLAQKDWLTRPIDIAPVRAWTRRCIAKKNTIMMLDSQQTHHISLAKTMILGSFWGRLGVMLGSSWGHLGVILGSSWDHFGGILGSLWHTFCTGSGHFGHTFFAQNKYYGNRSGIGPGHRGIAN